MHQVNQPFAAGTRILQEARPWQPVASAPFDRDLELSVIENGEVYSLAFSCRRTEFGWVEGRTRKSVLVDPTHWREWSRRP
jgi:hypothetical protein